MKSLPLDISYFGARNYIDVSTLTSAVYRAVPNISDNKKMTSMNGRLLKKITHKCELLLGPTESNEMQQRIVATFDWLYEGSLKEMSLYHTDELIVERRQEILEKDLSHYITYSNGEVIINQAINDDSIYNFMKMGRLISTQKFSISPRVVKFHFDRLYDRHEMVGVVMKGKTLAKKNFYCLETFFEGKKFGEIIIKALPMD